MSNAPFYVAQVIAAGIENGELRATICFDPAPNIDVQTLAHWPQRIEALFAGGRTVLRLATIEALGLGQAWPAPDLNNALSFPCRRRYPLPGDRGALTALWSYVMTGREVPDWSGYVTLFERPSGGDLPALKGLPPVLPVARSDAAFRYTSERAQRIWEALKTTHSTTESAPSNPIEDSKKSIQSKAAVSESFYDLYNLKDMKPEELEKAKKEAEKNFIKALSEANTAEDESIVKLIEKYEKVSKACGELRDKYRAANNGQEIFRILDGARVAGTCGDPVTAPFSASSSKDDPSGAEDVRGMHISSTARDEPSQPDPGDGQMGEQAQLAAHRLLTLRTHPSLARLFNLVVDVKVDAEAVTQLAKSLRSRVIVAKDDGGVDGIFGSDALAAGGAAAFGYLGVSLQGEEPRVLTTTKVRMDASTIRHFWACTREEMQFRAYGKTTRQMLASCAVTQLDGVLDLGMEYEMTGSDRQAAESMTKPAAGTSALDASVCKLGRHRRYDIVTTNVLLAAEGDVRRIRWPQEQADTAARAGAEAGSFAGARPRPELTTSGLALVDRWRQGEVVRSMVDASFRGKIPSSEQPLVLDANDLTFGYKIDVGLPSASRAGHSWRTLMNRTIRFEDIREKVDIDALITRLLPDTEERARVESATVLVPVRRRQAKDKTYLHVEETLAQWEGDPLGLSCDAAEGAPQSQLVDVDKDLAVSRIYGLFQTDMRDNYRCFPQRLAFPYRFGVRPVLAGGVCLRLEYAEARYELALSGRLGLPRPPAALFDAISKDHADWSAASRASRGGPAAKPAATGAGGAKIAAAKPAAAMAAGKTRAVYGRRLLRHEPVGVPRVLMLADEALWTNTDVARDLAAASAPVVTLRTCQHDPSRSHLRVSRRMVLPPTVSLHFAGLHGVFDRQRVTGPQPVGGLKAFDYDAEWGEFPLAISGKTGTAPTEARHRPWQDWHRHVAAVQAVIRDHADPGPGLVVRAPKRQVWTFTAANQDFKSRLEQGEFDSGNWIPKSGAQVELQQLINQHLYSNSPKVTPQLQRILQVPKGEPFVREATVNDARLQARVSQYYPDPAATFLVAAVRRSRATADANAAYFNGDPLVIPLYPEKAAFPDVRPVVFEFAATSSMRSQPPEQADFLRLAASGPVATGAGKPGQAIAQKVVVNLCFGEEVEVDIWCLPSAELLARWFDVIEVLTHEINFADVASDEAAGDDDEKRLKACVKGVATRAGLDPAQVLALLSPSADGRGNWSGARCEDIPKQGTKLVAAVIHDYMRRRPLPDLAAVTSISALHAFDRPVRAPEFDAGEAADESHGIKVARVDPASDERKAFLRSGTAPSDIKAERTALVFSGKVQVDLDTSDALELRAFCVSPRSSAFDDVTRGRSTEQRQRGEWPVKPKDRGAASGAAPDYLQASTIFGFHVAADGRVTLPRQEVRLLRFDGLPVGESNFTGLETGNLATWQLLTLKTETKSPERGQLRTSEPEPITDSLARRLTLSLVATGRYAPHFRRVVADEDGQLETTFGERDGTSDKPPLSARTLPEGIKRPVAETTPPAVVVQQADVWVMANCRPSRVSPLSIVPAFLWSDGSEQLRRMHGGGDPERTTTLRKSVLRIRMARPWFSSGEGERLGIVLWPPHIATLTNTQVAANRIRREDGQAPDMDLSHLDDADIGPGGAFVTRWGADPIRRSPAPFGMLMPFSAFSDADGRGDGLLVENVEMPLPRVDALAKPDLPPSAMRVSLLTFEPRFDPDQEHWYVDVAVDSGALVEPFVRFGLVRYQKHAPLPLQVSEPVVEWAQVPPWRRVSVGVQSNPASQDTAASWRINVEVSGPAAARALDAVPGELTVPELQGIRVLPYMRVGLIERGAAVPGGRETERPAQLSAEGSAAEVEVNGGPADPKSGLGPVSWCCHFDVPANPRETRSGRRYFVTVEEIEEYPRTSYAHEPLGSTEPETPAGAPAGKDRAPHLPAQSGPRFAARLEIN